MDASSCSCVTISPTMWSTSRSTSIMYQVTSSVPCRRRRVSQDVLENLGHVVGGHEQEPLSSLSTLSHSFTGRRSYDRTIVSTTCRTRSCATATTDLCIKPWLVQPLISVYMMVSKVAWWLMEWVCRRLWALYPPNMKLLYYPHVDPVEVAMALNPSRLPHWGRFVTFSMWLKGYLPRLTDRVRVYNTVLRRQPRFIPCLYALYGRWLQATLWRNVANVPRRRRRRTYSLPIPTLAHKGRWEGCVDLPARRG